MDGYPDDLDKDINRFKEDLSLFEVPTPQTYWREVTAKKSDTSAGEEFKCKQSLYMAHMQQQQQQQHKQTTQMKYTQKTLVSSSGFGSGMEHPSSLLQHHHQFHQQHAGLLHIRGDSKPPIPMILGQPGIGAGPCMKPPLSIFPQPGSSILSPSFHSQSIIGTTIVENCGGSAAAFLSGFPRYPMGTTVGFKHSSSTSSSPSFPNSTIPPPPPPPSAAALAAAAAAHAAAPPLPPLSGIVMATSTSTPTMIPIQLNSNMSSASSSYPSPGGTSRQQQSGSNYSSPRSSVGSGDSKNSSPRTSLIGTPAPPLPLSLVYDQRFGSPRSSNTSSKSSISAGSVDSKHSSPRASLTGPLYDRFPSPRNSIVIANHERSVGPHPDSVLNSNTYPPHINHQTMMMQTATNSGGGTRTILGDRFNEPAPPHVYNEPRYRTHPIIVSTPSAHDLTADALAQPIYANTAQLLQSAVQNTMQSQAPSISGGFPIQTTAHMNIPKPTIPGTGLGMRLPLYYETMPPKQSGPSEAEKKLAALTQQLENEMRISTTPRKSTDIPKEPPPPYHGPHKTEPMPGSATSQTSMKYANAPTSVANETAVTNQTSHSTPGCNKPISEATPKSTTVSPHLTYQVTPGPSKGPSEAEKKLAALTQQLEDDMENNPQGDYYGSEKFGEFLTSEHVKRRLLDEEEAHNEKKSAAQKVVTKIRDSSKAKPLDSNMFEEGESSGIKKIDIEEENNTLLKDVKLRLNRVWEALSPPIKEHDIVGKWFAVIFANKKRKSLYIAEVVQRFLTDKDGPIDTLMMRCLKPKVGSGTLVEDTPPHLPDISAFVLENVISGPLDVTPKGASLFDVPDYENVVRFYNIVKDIDRKSLMD